MLNAECRMSNSMKIEFKQASPLGNGRGKKICDLRLAICDLRRKRNVKNLEQLN